MVVREFAAEATLSPCEADRLVAPGPGGEPLMRAALARFRTRVHAIRPVEIACATTVPREVGLAGSSAIIIAVLRALSMASGCALAPEELAHIALEVETEDLGIVAGLQDRLVQAHGGLVQMDFGPASGVELLDPLLLPGLYVAWSARAAAPSGRVHAKLRERWRRGDAEVRQAMVELARHAAAARDALLDGDARGFAHSVDASFEVRRRIMPVAPEVIRMAEIARAHGASANSAGSGGATVGSLPDAEGWPTLSAALREEGYETIHLTGLEGNRR